MGVSVSKPGNSDPLHLCKERTEYVKQAIDSRYALSAAHLCYIQSLRNIGSALRQFVELEIPVEQALANLDLERTLSPSSFSSQSPTHMAEGSPLCYMRSSASHDVIHRVGSSKINLLNEQISSSWDYFDLGDPEVCEKFQNLDKCYDSPSPKFSKLINLRQFKESDVVPLIEEQLLNSYRRNEELIDAIILDENVKYADLCRNRLHYESVEELHGSKMKKVDFYTQLCAEREDASEFITHRAKDFLSSIKDIEIRFLRAAEAGTDILKMLETRKIWFNISTEILGKWPSSRFLSSFLLSCCKNENALHHKNLEPVTKVITWNRPVSSLSSSSSCKNHLALAHSFESGGDDGGDFSDEFCMISGSHSCTLERLYAWEKKLFDEVKASETIRKEFDHKCRLLRHQYARGLSIEAIDKTRSAVKDLHSQLRVSVQAVDYISKKIEKLRDAELQPQLLELTNGLVRMWKVMLECHHAQFITISLAYHVRSSRIAFKDESYRQTLMHFHGEVNCYLSCFTSWINAHKYYLEALNMWLQKCILPPRECHKYRKVATAFPPRQTVFPPIFVLCQNWLAGINSLAYKELCDAIGGVVSIIESKENEKWYGDLEIENMLESVGREEKKGRENWRLSGLQTSLKRWFDQLTKVSEAAVKIFEDVQKSNDAASMEYKQTIGF
ncbi:nitrate regulatory gene2 protein-like [Dendrobium catenatum]|uniref:DUF632 domain-containing protein n=1 Tax=Dendrobium catenatum TaxID=906689 RepID=A0A2I0WZ53_9ASPA|nr:nitrate regulatory gene2 protein-like [Dendrobium catenatum]XP_028550276.1 nitrate regulatory gene2 protein-like [Dendrobium catenatum]PKU80921.1 hypothetical protein MA16_Dca025505 [Dendrobium catenatum]